MVAPTRWTSFPATREGQGRLDAFERILGTSAHACAIRSFGRQAAAVDAPVFLTGETGTGKGVLARAIHDAGPRGRAAFVAVNCAGVPDALFESEFFGHVRGAFTGALQAHRGWFEQADRGTLFLDELVELPAAAQAKLLTALDDGEIRRVGAERAQRVNARMIAASNADPAAAVRERRLRIDLYHRLRVLTFQIPPLRARKDDIQELAHHYLTTFAARYARPPAHLTAAALDLLCTHDWPGNIRELAHTLEAALLTRPHHRITTDVLQPLIADSPIDSPAAATIEPATGRYAFLGSAEEELDAIRAALRACRGNKTRAARRLGMSRNTLLGKLRRFPAAMSHFAMEPEPGFHHRPQSSAQSPRTTAQLHSQTNGTHEPK